MKSTSSPCEAVHIDKCSETCPCLRTLRPASALDIYTDILRQRKENNPLLPDPLYRENSEDCTHAFLQLRKDFSAGKVVWFNVWYQDMFIGLRVNHPLIGMIWPPKGHPFTREERIYVFVVGLMVALFWSIIFESAFADSPPSSSHAFVSFLFTQGLAACLWLFNKMMVTAAECGCVQGKSSCCRNSMERLGQGFLLLALALGICHIFLFAFAYASAPPVVKNGFGSRYVNGILSQWFLWSFLPFLYFFYTGRKKELESKPEVLPFVISYQETEAYMASLESKSDENGGEVSTSVENIGSEAVSVEEAVESETEK